MFNGARIGLLAAFIATISPSPSRSFASATMPIPLAMGGTAWTRPTNSAALAAITWLSSTSATAAVIPDAAGINYAAGRASSVAYTEMHPMGLAMYGQSNVVAAFDHSPPDYILIMDFPETAFGAASFGRDYGLSLSSWIARHYRPIGIFAGGDHPIELWKFRKPDATHLAPALAP